jgi:hypothetical protein
MRMPEAEPHRGFCAGTRVVTLDGEMPVERLRPGMLVLTLSGNGAPLKPVVRVGQARIDPAADADTVRPVRIAADAIGPGVPIRDLCVAPGHGIAVEDADGRRGLVPAASLVNGATIRREPACDTVAYVEVATATHELLMADGMAAESTVDPPSPTALQHLAAAAAREVHARLLARARSCGHVLTEDPGLTLLCAGGTAGTNPAGMVAAEMILGEAGDYVFLLPPGCPAVLLRSRRFVPAETDPAGGDSRRLGVALDRIVHDGIELDMAGPACGAGFLPPEGEAPLCWRWTTGDAVLALPEADQETVLELRLRRGWSRYWLEPAG